MAVTWPDGSVTGSVRVAPAPIPAESEPENSETVSAVKKKEASNGDR